MEPTTDDSSGHVSSDFEQGQDPRTVKNLIVIYFKYLILNSNLGVPIFVTASEDTISIVVFDGKVMPPGGAARHVERLVVTVTSGSVCFSGCHLTGNDF